MLHKICPNCGAQNPKNNSGCVVCKRDLSLVEAHEMALTDPTLPTKEYQPTLSHEDALNLISMHGLIIGFIATIAAQVGTKNDLTQADPTLKHSLDLVRTTLHRLLYKLFGRPPTTNEVETYVTALNYRRMGESFKRILKVFEEVTTISPTPEENAYGHSVIDKIETTVDVASSELRRRGLWREE